MEREARIGAIRVLLADDDERYVEALRELIERQPELTVVGVAHDGDNAVELVGRLRPDAAVIDLHMPRANGVTAVARLRQAHPALCLIALTGDGDQALHDQAREAGADGVLLKGQMIEGLLERLGASRMPS